MSEYSRELNGTIRVFASNCSIYFEDGKYWFCDEYASEWYAAKWSNRDKLFEIFEDLEFLTYKEGCQLIQKHFKRKTVKFNDVNVSGFGWLWSNF